MRNLLLTVGSFFCLATAQAQKKPLDHSVYDSWQSIGERSVSNDGRWISYSINVQEGDNLLVVRNADSSYYREIPRGYGAVITEDNKFLICRIRPPYADTREARIKKKRPDDMPKDSLAIVWLGKDSIWKKERVKSFKTPEESFGWVAYHLEKKIVKPSSDRSPRQADPRKTTDSLRKVIDSLEQLLIAAQEPKKKKKKDEDTEWLATDAEGDEDNGRPADTGSDLVLRKLSSDQSYTFERILDFQFDKKGRRLLLSQAKEAKDSTSMPLVLLFDLQKGYADTISRGGNDFRQFTFSEDGSQLAFVAERHARPKDLQKFYKLYHYRAGMDSAIVIADKATVGMTVGHTVSENGNVYFSKNGQRLFFGTAPIMPPRDTNLVEMDLVKLDIWHYNDDYLQTQQLSRLQRDLRESFLAVYDFGSNRLIQLANRELPGVYPTQEGDGDLAYGITDYGNRVESQWAGNTKKDIYQIDLRDGSKKLIKKGVVGFVNPGSISPSGQYFVWYETIPRQYVLWDGNSIRTISNKIPTKLFNEEHDSPSDPSPYGIMGWNLSEDALFIYDRYDIWQVDPLAKKAPRNLTNSRKSRQTIRYHRLDREERGFKEGQLMAFRRFNEVTKEAAYMLAKFDTSLQLSSLVSGAYSLEALSSAKNAPVYLYTKERYEMPTALYVAKAELPAAPAKGDLAVEKRLTYINPQQEQYNWGTAELYSWKTFSGKSSQGILYKPEDFDPTKKYPMIIYFYETLSDGLYNYQEPAPTPSRLNISFFVSRGYLVFAPDIRYTIGHPAKSAYDYIVSGTQALMKNKWVDSKHIGIQGQSWGGIQVAQLITMTDIYAAAWAGAPVANMTSAYGGIRWESGANRQFQYEKTQSRIGATLWEKPELYIESSPLFHLPKVKTPLVIMANDADGAVPWYQGIELFTGMRRLGKKVWMLNYNGEAHNLVQRKNRKDIQIREQQFFDWLLKGEAPTRWITEGVPAVMKGKDWGLEK